MKGFNIADNFPFLITVSVIVGGCNFTLSLSCDCDLSDCLEYSLEIVPTFIKMTQYFSQKVKFRNASCVLMFSVLTLGNEM